MRQQPKRYSLAQLGKQAAYVVAIGGMLSAVLGLTKYFFITHAQAAEEHSKLASKAEQQYDKLDAKLDAIYRILIRQSERERER